MYYIDKIIFQIFNSKKFKRCFKLTELRDKTVSARIKPSAKRIMENSKYSYGDAIEYFAFNILNKDEDMMQRLKHLKIESKHMESQMRANQIEIDLICQEMGIQANDDLLFADEIRKNVRAVIRWYKRQGAKYGSIENFMELRHKKLRPYADESGLEYDEFTKRVISEYNSKKREKSIR